MSECRNCKWCDGGKYFEDEDGDREYKLYCRYHKTYTPQYSYSCRNYEEPSNEKSNSFEDAEDLGESPPFLDNKPLEPMGYFEKCWYVVLIIFAILYFLNQHIFKWFSF